MKKRCSQTAAYKVVQKQFYDLISHRHAILFCFCGLVIIAVSAFSFGEAALEWSKDQYDAVFHYFSDNILGRSLQNRLCQIVPIDVVYTWVNGSDTRLLVDLKSARERLEVTSNQTEKSNKTIKCAFVNCFESYMVILKPNLEEKQEFTPLDLRDEVPLFQTAWKITYFRTPYANVSIISLGSAEAVHAAALAGNLTIRGKVYQIRKSYLTSDATAPHSFPLDNIVLLTGLKIPYSVDELRSKLPRKMQSYVTRVFTQHQKNMAILCTTNKLSMDVLMGYQGNLTVDKTDVGLWRAHILWKLVDDLHFAEYMPSRFQDNEELRYSLRSLEKHAPWVRHVYIVTNGQIPYWLNLDNSRLTLVTHEEIFPNKSHLPTFSSTAIESHIHRIPGLSQKFIYLNDDVMFGKDVWPEDFYTHSRGYKVYLSWPVPGCNDACPSSWINDGYCDKACNNSECDWDGGDCKDGAKGFEFGGGLDDSDSHCSSGCANSWIADKYCDTVCDVYECAFDAGDCSDKNFHKMYKVLVEKELNLYTIPKGLNVFYLDFSQIFSSESEISDSSYDEPNEKNAVVRAAGFSQPHKTLHVVLHHGKNATNISFTVFGKDLSNHTLDLKINVSVDTRTHLVYNHSRNKEIVAGEADQQTADEIDELPITFEEVAQRGPKLVPTESQTEQDNVNYDNIVLPPEVEEQISSLSEQFTSGELTEKGLKVKKSEIISNFLANMRVRNQPIRYRQDNRGSNNIEQQLPRSQREQIKQQLPRPAVQSQPAIQNPSIEDLPQQNGHALSQSLNDQQSKTVDKIRLPVEPVISKQRGNVDSPPVFRAPPKVSDNNKEHIPHVLVNEDSQVKKPLVHGLPGNSKLPPSGVQKHDDDAILKDIHAGKLPIEKPKEFRPVQPDNLGGDSNRAINLPRPDILHEENIQVENIDGAPVNKPSEDILSKKSEQVASQNNKEDMGVINRKLKSVNDLPLEYSIHNTLEDEVPDDEYPLLWNMTAEENEVGFLPWEKQETFSQEISKQEAMKQYETDHFLSRKTLDAFSNSLRHVNRMYNKHYGYSARKVPAHMPLMVDKNIMQRLQDRFSKEWDLTSSNTFRGKNDMQFSFSYFYFLISEKMPRNISQIFDEYDTDKTGTWSDREIRTLATRLYDAPLTLETMTKFENLLINCSNNLPPKLKEEQQQHTTPYYERYYDSKLPTLTKSLVVNCEPLIAVIKQKMKPTDKYKHQILNDDDVAFKMISSNISSVVGDLDDLRRHPKKFICLNDNMDHKREETNTVKALLMDYYESIFPLQSQFELPLEYRNRFLHIDELRSWRIYRDILKVATYVCLALLIAFSAASFCQTQLNAVKRRFCRKRSGSNESNSSCSEGRLLSV